MLVLGTALAIPMSLLAAYAPSDEVLFVARVGGGLAAGMAFPTTLALITALWAGPGRTKAIALWSGIGGAIAALGPLLSGLLLEHFWWGSVFLITLPLALVALVLAWLLVPAHVNETSDPVDNLGGILSVVLVAALILAINFAPVPNEGALVAGLAAIALAASSPSISAAAGRNPLYDLHVAGRRTFWVAACAGIIVFGSLMGAMFIGQQFLQNVLGYSTLDAGLAILPAALFMVLVAPRSAKLVEAHGARATLLLGYVFVLLGFLTMLLLWKEDISYWKVGLGYAFVGIGVGLAGTPASHSLTGSVPVTRAGMASGTADLQRDLGRRDHAVDLRRAPDRRLRERRGGRDRRVGEGRLRQRPEPADEVVRRRRGDRPAVPAGRRHDHRRGQDVVPPGRPVGLPRRHRRRAPRRRARLLPLPEARRGAAPTRRIPRRGLRQAGTRGSTGAGADSMSCSSSPRSPSTFTRSSRRSTNMW